MGTFVSEDICGYYVETGGIRAYDGGDLPDHVKVEDIITRDMIENSDTLYFDDLTGKRLDL